MASTPASVRLLAITRSHSGFVSNSSAHDVVAWRLCSQRLRACNNQYISIRSVKMCGFKIGSDFSVFFESFWTVSVGVPMCLILPAPLRPASALPADAPIRTSSTACPILCFLRIRTCTLHPSRSFDGHWKSGLSNAGWHRKVADLYSVLPVLLSAGLRSTPGFDVSLGRDTLRHTLINPS